ncbi:hypothetical protein LOK49_LG09G00925 [Camellia lanceoleosa]|uniref:Uncharacterized protein n=1 Tax=Camellia lanceoleosa TaxID=1840588 RepID=A0ACC0GK08_9ERIC|nr:hypothetical protein LOK49_LG09G00925 [Camellia lanceoleosa]
MEGVLFSDVRPFAFDIYIDGTTNFAHCYPSFAVSVGVLYKKATLGVVNLLEPLCVGILRRFSVLWYEHDDACSTNIELFKELTDVSRGVRRLGAAVVDICHVALGILEAYWEYCLNP